MTAHIIRSCIVASHDKTKQGEARHQPFPLLTDERTTALQRLVCDKKAPDCVPRLYASRVIRNTCERTFSLTFVS